VKYADDLVLLDREEKVLQGVVDGPIEIGRRYGMEMNVEKTKVMRISRTIPNKIYDRSKAIGECKYFNYLGSTMQGVYVKLNPELSWQKQHLTRRRLFTSKLNLNLRKKVVKCYIWSIALYGAEKWTLRKVDQTYLGSFEMWCWRRMEKISCTDRVRN
jgi:hypothetical protein